MTPWHRPSLPWPSLAQASASAPTSRDADLKGVSPPEKLGETRDVVVSSRQSRRLRGQHGHPTWQQNDPLQDSQSARCPLQPRLLVHRRVITCCGHADNRKNASACISAARSSSQQAWRLAWAGTRSIGFPPSPPTATVARTCVVTLRCAFFLCEERLDPRRHSSAGHRT